MHRRCERLDEIEALISDLQDEYEETCARLKMERAESGIKTEAYKELSARKIDLKVKLAMFKPYDFSDGNVSRKAFSEYSNLWNKEKPRHS